MNSGGERCWVIWMSGGCVRSSERWRSNSSGDWASLFIRRTNIVWAAAGQSLAAWAGPWWVRLPVSKRSYVPMPSSALDPRMRHSWERAGCASLLASPHLSCASHLLEVGSGTERVPRPKMHLSSQNLLCSLSRSKNACPAVATGLVRPLPCNGWQAGLWDLLVLLLLLCLPALAVVPPLPCHLGCSQDVRVCHWDGGDTLSFPAWNPHLPADRCASARRGGGVRKVVVEEWIPLPTKPFFVRGTEREDTLQLPPLALLKLRDAAAVPWADKAGTLSLCPPGWQGAGNVNLLYTELLKVREKHGKNSFRPFPLAGLEGIWWPGSLVAFQSHFWCRCRPQAKGIEKRRHGRPKSHSFMNQRFLKPFKKIIVKYTAVGQQWWGDAAVHWQGGSMLRSFWAK